MNNKVSRRQFVKSAAKGLGLGLAAPYMIASGALGAPGVPPASDRIGVGHIGVGGMGSGHLGRYAKNPEFPTVAVCDVDEQKRISAARRVGEKCGLHNDFRELLDRKDVDAVVIATPDHWHALTAIYACEAGKDIYCEKPLTLTIAQGRAMVSTVRRYGSVFQTGSQQRSGGEFRKACELVRSGRIGKLQTVYVNLWGSSRECYLPAEPTPKGMDWNLWIGPAPWRPFNRRLHPASWRGFRDYSGGTTTDWGAHHLDIAQWALGMSHSGPVEILPPKDKPQVTIKYANGVPVLFGGSNVNGILFEGTDGKIEVNRGHFRSEPEEIGKDPLGPGDVHLYKSPGHARDWQNCVRTRQKPICDVEIGHRSVTVCHLVNLSVWLRREIRWDPKKEQIIGDDEANKWLDRPMRAPWHL